MTTKRGRKPAAVQHAGTGHTCGECVNGRYNLANFNYEGKPFMIYCEHGERGYSHVEKSNVTYAYYAACECFKSGERPNWRTKGGRV